MECSRICPSKSLSQSLHQVWTLLNFSTGRWDKHAFKSYPFSPCLAPWPVSLARWGTWRMCINNKTPHHALGLPDFRNSHPAIIYKLSIIVHSPFVSASLPSRIMHFLYDTYLHYMKCETTFTHWDFQFSRSVMSDSLRSHESQHARPPCPSPTPGVHPDSRP